MRESRLQSGKTKAQAACVADSEIC